MLIAMVVSLSMLTGCFSFLLAGTDDDDSREPSQVAETRKPKPQRKPKPRPRPRQKRPRPKPQPKPSVNADEEYTESPAEDEPDTSYTADSASFASAGSVRPVNSYGFVEIIPPKEGIPGLPIDPITNPVVENKDHYKGIFLEGKTIKIKPYLIAETEVTYKLWRKVYNWAIKHGYKFQSPGHPTGYYQLSSIANRAPLPELKKYENHPIEHLTWVDCIVWCNAYTEMETNSDAQCVYRISRTNNAVIKDAFKGSEATKAGPGVTEAAGAYCDMSKKGYRLPTEA